MCCYSRYLFAFLFILATTAPINAQDDGPKVALVLSGGGAKGFSHIGVRQALEEAGIYPDIVTGTSMGGVVGGLYALGYSADEIQALTADIDWNTMLGNQIPFEDVSFEEKAYYGRYITELPVKGVIPQLPRGLIEGQNLNNLLADLTRSAHGIESFDDLPIPFRCVSTDIATGTRVLLKNGSLPESLRATMAIPSIFTPVEINDTLMVDGGLVRNFPVQEALDMGADIVIGIFVSDDLDPKEDLNTMFDILMQSAWVMGAFDTRDQIKLVDYYIEPNLEGFSTGDFNSAKAIIKRGQEKGQELLPQFKQLADSLKRIGKVFKKPVKLPQRDVYRFSSVDVRGNEEIPDEFINGKLGISLNDSLNIKQIDSRIQVAYGSRYFSKINYEILPNDTSYALTIKVQERNRKFLKTALYYNNETGTGLNVNLT
jgi:NTE family protein